MDEKHVIFGTGPLGQAVMHALDRRGKPVMMINRSGKRPPGAPERVLVVAGDAYDPEFAATAARGASVIYQCAQPAYTEWVTRFLPLQKTILDAAAAAGAKLIVGDNLYMYGEVRGVIREDLPWAATTRKGKVRARAAQMVMDACKTGAVRAAIGRGSDFFGPSVLDSAAGDRMFLPAVRGKAAGVWGDPDAPHTYTYIEDFGEALAVLGERDEALGQVWHVPNADTVTSRRFVQMIFEALGHPVKMSRMGRLMMAIGGIFIPAARETVEMMYEFEKPFVVDSTKFTGAFGVTATPLKESIRQTVDWYRAHATQEHPS